MTLTDEIQPWLFPVEPLEGESLSHFLGSFRRRNHLSPSALGQLAGIGAVVARWERFHLNPFPSTKELEGLAKVVGVEAQRLREMLPAAGSGDEVRSDSVMWGVLCRVALSSDRVAV
jgi:hypothetical protein